MGSIDKWHAQKASGVIIGLQFFISQFDRDSRLPASMARFLSHEDT